MQKILRRKTVADLLDTTPEKLSALIAKGLFPRPHRLGRLSVWPESVVQEWLELNLKTPEEAESTRVWGGVGPRGTKLVNIPGGDQPCQIELA